MPQLETLKLRRVSNWHLASWRIFVQVMSSNTDLDGALGWSKHHDLHPYKMQLSEGIQCTIYATTAFTALRDAGTSYASLQECLVRIKPYALAAANHRPFGLYRSDLIVPSFNRFQRTGTQLPDSSDSAQLISFSKNHSAGLRTAGHLQDRGDCCPGWCPSK